MNFGVSAQDFALLKKILFDPIHAHQGSVWIFGSRARGQFHPYSDLDVLIVAPHLPQSLLLDIKEKLEESNLPFKVDIVLEENLAKSYRDQVMRERIKLPFIAK